MRDIRNLSAVGAVVLVILLLITAMGLAVPSITINVQEIGAGNCDVKSPVQWATISLYWSQSGITWTLSGASVVFSDNVSGSFNFTAKIEIYGYNWNKGSFSTDVIAGTLYTSSGIASGISYSLTLNDTPQYVVLPQWGYPEPEITNATGVVVGGSTSCVSVIDLLVKGIGVGSTSYSPPPASIPAINITVDNTGNSELKDYVVNFTVSPSCISNLSRVYVTDSSGNPLYFWVFNDSANGKIWFWVNYTVPADSVSNITIHLNGTGTSSYFDPNKVFWYFNDTPLSLQAGVFSGTAHIIDYPISNFFSANYSGYAVDTNATLAKPTTWLGTVYPNRIGPYFVSFYYSGYYLGIGAAGNSSLYLVYGTSLTGINNAGNSLGTLPSWGPGIYSVVNYGNGTNYYTHLNFEGGNFFEGQWTSGVYLLSNFVLGQRYGGPSVYDWIGMRPVAYPFPTIIVPADCAAPVGGGKYTFTLYFRP